jgi:NAD(P)-dependent dehydrogenase (short-subunit alcohol dehydrogenase family)
VVVKGAASPWTPDASLAILVPEPLSGRQFGRFIQPEEVADLAAFLIGPSGCSTTGQRLITCAGASL